MPDHPATTVSRRLVHTRQIVCTGYLREDGLYDIEARMTDTKGHDTPMLLKDLQAGEALHDMWLTLTVDDDLMIRSACTRTLAAPTPYCTHINETYARLAGVRITEGFMREVRARVGGIRGCTHLTELLGPMATTAFQTIMGLRSVEKRRARGQDNKQLPLLGTCYAWRADGEVAKHMRQRSDAADPDTPVPHRNSNAQ